MTLALVGNWSVPFTLFKHLASTNSQINYVNVFLKFIEFVEAKYKRDCGSWGWREEGTPCETSLIFKSLD